MVFGEYDTSLFQALGGIGLCVYIGTCALLVKRAIGGDSLAYFAGNAVAATLLLLSNLGDVDAMRILGQLALIVLGFVVMVFAFPIDQDN